MIKPAIIVWCLPDMTEEKLKRLHERIVSATVEVYDLRLAQESDMFVFFPKDMMRYGLGKEILIQVTDLLLGNDHLRRKLAGVLVRAVHEEFPEARVQCVVRPYDRNSDEYWTTHP